MRSYSILCIAFVVALIGLIYWPVCQYGFVAFGDYEYVLQNPHVVHGLSLSSIRWAFATVQHGTWNPLTWLSLLLDSSIWGRWPGGYHITNVALHTANTICVLLILVQ